MTFLEDKIRPPFVAQPVRRDLLGIVLLAALAASLLPTVLFYKTSASADPAVRHLHMIPLDEFASTIIDPMVSVYLPAALGFLLVLRRGGFDLSVWAIAGAGGIISAALINAGVGPAWSMILAVAAGAIVGAINGLVVSLLRVPSVLATIATALAIMWACQLSVAGRAIPVSDNAFAAWHLSAQVRQAGGDSGDRPAIPPGAGQDESPAVEVSTLGLSVTRMLLVGCVYGLAMFVLIEGGSLGRRGKRPGPRRAMFLSLCASGALAAASGTLWVLEHGSAPVLTRPVGDLRIPVAAILAGGAYFGGRGRTLLAGLCLPPAMLLVVLWRQGVWNYQIEGYAVQVLALAVLAFVTYLAFSRALAGRHVKKPLAVASAALCACGMVIIAATAGAGGWRTKRILCVAGFVTWSAGLALLLVSRGLAERAKRQLA